SAKAIDPFDPAGAVVIPAGRFCGVGYVGGRGNSNFRFLLSDTGKTPITLADGNHITPAGMAVNQMYKLSDFFMTSSNTNKIKRGFVGEVPYVLAIQNSYGTLNTGDFVTAYSGTT